MSFKLVTGLGNPGPDYARTPHNVGFRVVDRIAADCSATWKEVKKFSAAVAKVKAGPFDLILAKPATFMNRSGESVMAIARYYGLAMDETVVVYDDADLPLGKLRLRPCGGSGGHRGLRSVIEACGTEAFARVRVGIGRSLFRENLADYVLARLSPEEEKVLSDAEAVAAGAVQSILRCGIDKAMNKFNNEDAAVASPIEG